jgi:hypothetical protein
VSLKAFHVVFISASVLLAFVLAVWCFGAGERPDAGRAAAGVGAVAAGLALAAYEAWFVRKMRRLP